MIRLGVSRGCESARRHTFSLTVPEVQLFGNLLLAIKFGRFIFGDLILVNWYWQSDLANLILSYNLESWHLIFQT